MTAQPHRFGGYDVTTLLDGIFEAPSDVLIHQAGETARTEAIARFGQPKISIEVNCFALRGEGGVTLVDAGTGPSWGAALGHAPAAMAKAGIRPEDVQHVLVTHLHGDHALGLFNGERPFFPNAQIIVPQADLGYYGDETKRAATPDGKRGAFDIAASLQRLYVGRIETAAPGEVLPGIELIPLPGHSFGHSGYLVGDGDRSLLLWGDALHLGALQAAPAYRAVLRRFPKAMLWPGDRGGPPGPEVRADADGGQTFVVSYRLQDGCHACAIIGEARFGFVFDAAGTFRGTRLMSVEEAHR